MRRCGWVELRSEAIRCARRDSYVAVAEGRDVPDKLDGRTGGRRYDHDGGRGGGQLMIASRSSSSRQNDVCWPANREMCIRIGCIGIPAYL